MDVECAHRLAREKDPSRLARGLARVVLWPFAKFYLRLDRFGATHIPQDGPVLIASNHRSFLDPFIIGLCVRRPLRFMAKVELFDKRWKARALLALGAFPVRRGQSDEQAMETARVILERGGVLGIFPEGTRVRPGPLAEPRRGVGRLALETGAQVVPVAITGTDDIRDGWRVRPRKVRVRFGPSRTYPRPVDGRIRAALAREVTARVWSCVELQWEWLGGPLPIRTAVVVGAGSWGTAIATMLARGGVAVQLGCRTPEQAATLAAERVNDRYLPEVALPEGVRPVSFAELDLDGVDLVCLAVPARALPRALELIESPIASSTGVVILSKGLIAPAAQLPSDFVRARTGDRPLGFIGGPAHAREAAVGEAGLVLASTDVVFRARMARALAAAGLECEQSADVIGVQLAGCAKNAAALAAGLALERGLNAAGTAAARVYTECHELARRWGAAPETFAGVAGAGDLVATILAAGSRNRRAGELIAEGLAPDAVEARLGQAVEALDLVPLLAAAMDQAGVRALATHELAALLSHAADARERAPVKLSVA